MEWLFTYRFLYIRIVHFDYLLLFLLCLDNSIFILTIHALLEIQLYSLNCILYHIYPFFVLPMRAPFYDITSGVSYDVPRCAVGRI